MARKTPVHSGYTIINGAGAGINGNRIDVWAEYKVGSASVSGNCTPLTVYFYAALNPNYSSTTAMAGGLNSSGKVDGKGISAVSGGDYDFTSSGKVNFLGSFTGNISHDENGEKTVALSCSFTTQSGYITGGSVSGSFTLPKIPRQSSFGAITGTVLGDTMTVKINPSSDRYTHRVHYYIKDDRWSGAHTGITSVQVPLPLSLATLSKEKEFQLLLLLRTYEGETQVGGDVHKYITVTVPETDDTRPTLTATLAPADSPFDGIYLQSRSKVSAQLTATDPFGADIVDCGMTVEGKPYTGQSPVSQILDTAGELTVELTATNSRGFTATLTQRVSVCPYTAPYAQNLTIARTDLQGEPKADGECLYIEAAGVCADVGGMNTCALSWRVKPEKGSFTPWKPLTSGIVMENTLYKDTPWTVQIMAEDTAGGSSLTGVQLPSEKVYMHRPAGGAGLGLGGYVSQPDWLDVYWHINARQGITAPSVNARGACSDINTAYTPGVYRLTADTANNPWGEGILWVVNPGTTGGNTAFQLAATALGKVSMRLIWQGAAQSWKTV